MTIATDISFVDQEKRRRREISMYGCTEPQMREAIKESLTFIHNGPEAMVASLMSDAQEEMNFDIELARQTLNRAKWIIFNLCSKERK